MEKLYGHLTSAGYMGRLPDGTYMLFDTENEYVERFYEELTD